MAKKKAQPPKSVNGEDKPVTLKDLLDPAVLSKLKEQATAMKQEEEKRQEEARKRVEDERRQEQKRLEGNFEYLLNNSKQDWKKFK